MEKFSEFQKLIISVKKLFLNEVWLILDEFYGKFATNWLRRILGAKSKIAQPSVFAQLASIR